jgi:hypothetical protein
MASALTVDWSAERRSRKRLDETPRALGLRERDAVLRRGRVALETSRPARGTTSGLSTSKLIKPLTTLAQTAFMSKAEAYQYTMMATSNS